MANDQITRKSKVRTLRTLRTVFIHVHARAPTRPESAYRSKCGKCAMCAHAGGPLESTAYEGNASLEKRVVSAYET